MERVAFLGLGTMGAAMAANLGRAGYPLTVWNRTPGRAAGLVELGATEAATPAQAAAAADVVLVCVSVSPSVSRSIAERLATAGVGFVDAPVSGGSEGAQKGTLSIFCGGSPADVERARPVLGAMGRTITHVGSVGSGQAVKAVNQVILAGTYLGVAEGLVLAMKAGLDVPQVVDALGGGAAQSWVLANRSGRMIENEYPLGFKVALHLKDLGIALGLAEELGASLPVGELCEAIERDLVAAGHADDDMSAVARSIRSRSGLPD